MASTISDATPALDILIVVASLSGNTRELGRMIAGRCRQAGHAVHWQEADEADAVPPLQADAADLLLLGSWPDNGGRTPAEMKAWVARLAGSGHQPLHVAVFGTGETQWGAEYYGGAVHRLRRYFHSPPPPLLIEQMPHGDAHATAIAAWTDAVLDNHGNQMHADHRRHHA